MAQPAVEEFLNFETEDFRVGLFVQKNALKRGKRVNFRIMEDHFDESNPFPRIAITSLDSFQISECDIPVDVPMEEEEENLMHFTTPSWRDLRRNQHQKLRKGPLQTGDVVRIVLTDKVELLVWHLSNGQKIREAENLSIPLQDMEQNVRIVLFTPGDPLVYQILSDLEVNQYINSIPTPTEEAPSASAAEPKPKPQTKRHKLFKLTKENPSTSQEKPEPRCSGPKSSTHNCFCCLRECTICAHEKVLKEILVPCGHVVSCPDCTKELLRRPTPQERTCPICRVPIQKALEAFFP